MFVQGRDAIKRAGAGLGVGLALARSIVELHHGTMEARSEGPGTGSEFVIRLPLLPPPAEGGAAAPAPREEAAGHRRRVLVVDDNVDAAEVLATLLRHLGHEVHVVHDGAQALTVADGFRPEVILLDIGMPGMNGFEVARRLQERKRTPRPLVVALTGWGRPADEARSREAGFDLHLVKPVEEEQLRQLLEGSPRP